MKDILDGGMVYLSTAQEKLREVKQGQLPTLVNITSKKLVGF
jgi:hypothetical protein